jgi:hypothetical protein
MSGQNYLWSIDHACSFLYYCWSSVIIVLHEIDWLWDLSFKNHNNLKSSKILITKTPHQHWIFISVHEICRILKATISWSKMPINQHFHKCTSPVMIAQNHNIQFTISHQIIITQFLLPNKLTNRGSQKRW